MKELKNSLKRKMIIVKRNCKTLFVINEYAYFENVKQCSPQQFQIRFVKSNTDKKDQVL